MSMSRESVRALVLDPAGRILLSRVTPLGASGGRDLWVTLGGRLKGGEALVQALERELSEELAQTECEIGSEVWRGDEMVNWGGKEVRLLEHFFLVRVKAGDHMFTGHEEEEAANTHELRWWTAREIASSNAKFVPCDLAALLLELPATSTSECKRVRLEGDA
jgi:ADP-ribose pyrophosphatase YjhB (NUDIX family)